MAHDHYPHFFWCTARKRKGEDDVERQLLCHGLADYKDLLNAFYDANPTAHPPFIAVNPRARDRSCICGSIPPDVWDAREQLIEDASSEAPESPEPEDPSTAEAQTPDAFRDILNDI